MKIETNNFSFVDNIPPAIAADGWHGSSYLNLFDVTYLIGPAGRFNRYLCAKMCDDCLILGSSKFLFSTMRTDRFDYRQIDNATGNYYVQGRAFALKEDGEELDERHSVLFAYNLQRGRSEACFEFSIYFDKSFPDADLADNSFVAIFGDNKHYAPANPEFLAHEAKIKKLVAFKD